MNSFDDIPHEFVHEFAPDGSAVSLSPRVWAIVRVLAAAVNLGMDRVEVLEAMREMDRQRKEEN